MSTDDYIAIRRLQATYADIMSRRAFGELERVFLPDTAVTIALPGRTRNVTGPEAFGDFVARRVEHLEFFQFVILNAIVDEEVGPDPLRATGRLHFCELRQDAAEGRFSVLYGLYEDGYTNLEGRWWFAQRRFSPLAVTQPDLQVFGTPGDDY